MSDGSMDGALRAAFQPGESVVARLQRSTGVKSRILLHDGPDEESPLLRLGGGGGPGAEDDSRYRIVGEIAKGGVGVVYKARDRDLGRDVALKVLRKEHASNPEVLERLVEEAQIGGQLQHPGIVPVYGLGLQGDGRPYFAMKLVKGRTLAAVLKDRKDPLRDLPRFLRVFEQICQTMAYAHARGVIHRDLKPSNVMVGGFGEVLVVDWGFGKVLGRDDPMAEKLQERTIVATVRSKGEGSESIAGSVMGTPAYMPPEQALGQIETLDERCDVFALGAILCEILTGEPPYVGAPEDLLTMAAQARLEGAHERLSSCKADPALLEICRRALAPLRANRPEDASALAGALEEFLAAAERRAREAEVRAVHERARLEREREEALWARRAKRKTMALAAAAVAAVLVTGAAWFWHDARRREHAAEIRQEAQFVLGEATRLLGAEKWPEAAAEARRARDLAAQSDLLATLRDDAEALAARAEAEAARLARRDRLVATLEEIRLRLGDDFDVKRTDADYSEAFASVGLVVDRTDVDETVRFIGARGGPAAVQIAACLDAWAGVCRRNKELEGREWRKLTAIARAIDPDPWRTRFRDVVDRGDIGELRALAATDEARQQGALTLALFGRTLDWLGDEDAAETLLREAALRHPGDFWICAQLGNVLDAAGKHREAAQFDAAALAVRPESAGTRCNLGVALWGAGDLDAGIAQFREAIRLRPEYASAHANLAGALIERGPSDEAITAAREAIRLEPGLAVAHNNLAAALCGKGRFDEAIAACREAIRLRPGYVSAYGNLASALVGNGVFDEAVAAGREAIRLQPGDAGGHGALGSALLGKGLVDEAIAALREAIRLDPARADAHSSLGWALTTKGLVDEAIAACREAIRLRPHFAAAHNNLGIALHDKGLFDDAVEACREAVRLQPDYAAAHDTLGNALVAKGLLDEGIAALRESIRLAPHEAKGHSNLGVALKRRGLLDDAIAEYREAIRLRPDIANVHANLAGALGDKGLFDEAIAACREAIRLDPHWGMAYVNMGFALSRKGLPDEAIATYREAVRVQPTLALAHSNLGNALAGKRLFDEAIAACREAIRVDPGFATAHSNLGEALRGKGLIDEAVVAFRDAVRLEPDVAWHHASLAHALGAKAIRDGARGCWEEALAAHREAARVEPMNPTAWNNLAWFLATCPDAHHRDAAEAVALARRAAEMAPDGGYIRDTLGVALYHAGLHKDAAAALEDALRLMGGGDELASTRLFLAMAKWRLGEKEEARALLKRTAEWVERNKPDDQEFKRFRAEAEGLIGEAK